MVSTLKLTKIQIPNSDSDVISLDASTGNITLNKTLGGTSVTVQGEGTNTTNLQQGLVKFWHRMDASSGTPTVGDSFNAGTITDHTVGNFTIAFTNNMANTNYAHFSEARTSGLYSLMTGADYTTATSSVRCKINDTPNLSSADTQDHTFISDMIGGDLA